MQTGFGVLRGFVFTDGRDQTHDGAVVATVAQLIPLDTLSFALSVRAHLHPNPDLNPNPNPSRGPNRNPNPAPDAEQDDITNLTDDPDQSVPVFLSPGSSPITK